MSLFERPIQAVARAAPLLDGGTLVQGPAKALSSDLMMAWAQGDLSWRELVAYQFASLSLFGPADSSPRFVGSGFAVRPLVGWKAVVLAGLGFDRLPSSGAREDRPVASDGIPGLADLSPVKPLVLTRNVELDVPPPDAGLRTDLVEVRYRRRVPRGTDGRLEWDPSTALFQPVRKELTYVLDAWGYRPSEAGVRYVVGQVGQLAPSADTDNGYTSLAWIQAVPGATALTDDRITDLRRPLFLGSGLAQVSLMVTVAGASPNLTATINSFSAPAGVRVVAYGGGTAGYTPGTGDLGSCTLLVAGEWSALIPDASAQVVAASRARVLVGSVESGTELGRPSGGEGGLLPARQPLTRVRLRRISNTGAAENGVVYVSLLLKP